MTACDYVRNRFGDFVVCAVIFAYYFVATLFPIDKIIGRIYTIFGAILLLSAVGIFAGLFVDGQVTCEPAIFVAAAYAMSLVKFGKTLRPSRNLR